MLGILQNSQRLLFAGLEAHFGDALEGAGARGPAGSASFVAQAVFALGGLSRVTDQTGLGHPCRGILTAAPR